MTTGVESVTVQADQNRALKVSNGVLGSELRVDVEVWPGMRRLEETALTMKSARLNGQIRPLDISFTATLGKVRDGDT